MQDNIQDLLEMFFEEAAEHVVNMESGLLELEHSSRDQELLNSIFRCAHSIKGASAAFGLHDVARFTHSLENLLARMRDGTLEASPARVDLLLRSSDILRGLLESSKSGAQMPLGVEDVLTELTDVLGHGVKPVAKIEKPISPQIRPGIHEYCIVFVPNPGLLRQGVDPLLLIRDLSLEGVILSVTADVSRLPRLSEIKPDECYLGWTVRLESSRSPEQIADVFASVRDTSQVTVEIQVAAAICDGNRSSRPQSSVGPSTNVPRAPLRTPLTSANDLIKAAIELVRAQSQLNYAARDFAHCQYATSKRA